MCSCDSLPSHFKNICAHTHVGREVGGFLYILQDNLSSNVSLSLSHPRESTGERLCCNSMVGAVWLQLKLLCSIFSKSSSLFGFLKRFSAVSHVGSLSVVVAVGLLEELQLRHWK